MINHTTILAVVKNQSFVLFIGSREQCYDYMRKNKDWQDLRYVKIDNGKIVLWHLSSYVL